jgi:hypothetical protein
VADDLGRKLPENLFQMEFLITIVAGIGMLGDDSAIVG